MVAMTTNNQLPNSSTDHKTQPESDITNHTFIINSGLY